MLNTISSVITQAVETKSATVVPFKSTSVEKVETAQTFGKKQPSVEDINEAQRLEKAQEQTPLEEKSNNDKEITQQMLDELSTDFEILHSVGLSFAKHEDTGRTFIKVTNKDTDELIREIPSEDVLNMAAKLDEMIGILFDAKV